MFDQPQHFEIPTALCDTSDHHLGDYLQEQNQLSAYLGKFLLARTSTGNDGNCLFRAISFQMYQNENHHLELRQQVVKIIRQNMDFFSQFFLSSDNSKTLTSLAQDGVYAGQESLLALSLDMDISFLITMTSGPDMYTHKIHHPANTGGTAIHLAYSQWGGGHYESVRSQSTFSSPPSPKKVRPHGNKTKLTLNDSFSSLIDLSCFKPGSPSPSPSLISKQATCVQAGSESADHLYSKLKPGNSHHNGLQTTKIMCDQCNMQLANKSSLKRHMSRFHSNNPPKSVFFPCSVSSCQRKFYHIDTMVDHMISDHEADIQIECRNFACEDDFKDFLSVEENINHVKFVSTRKHQLNKHSIKTYQLQCFRSGKKKYVPKHKSKTCGPHKKGSCKIGSVCPARLYVKVLPDGQTNIKYIKSHSHELSFDQTKYLSLPEHIKEQILGQLSLNVPINSILDSVRNMYDDRDMQDNISEEDLRHWYVIDRRAILNLKQNMDVSPTQIHTYDNDDDDNDEDNINDIDVVHTVSQSNVNVSQRPKVNHANRASKIKTFHFLLDKLKCTVNEVSDSRLTNLIGEMHSSLKTNNASVKLQQLQSLKKKIKVAPSQRSVL